MNEMLDTLVRWQLDEKEVRKRVYRAPTARERERWHAVWLLVRGWPEAEVAEALERDLRTINEWRVDFERQGPAGMSFEQSGGSPPPSMLRNKPL
jgi:transposase